MRKCTRSAASPAVDPPLSAPVLRQPEAVSQKVLDRRFALAGRSSGSQLGVAPRGGQRRREHPAMIGGPG